MRIAGFWRLTGGGSSARPALVAATGVLEILQGLAGFVARSRRVAGLMLIALFVALFPAHRL